jgi:hypothetical protein
VRDTADGALRWRTDQPDDATARPSDLGVAGDAVVVTYSGAAPVTG